MMSIVGVARRPGPAAFGRSFSLVLLVAAALATPARADAPPPNVALTPDGGALAFQDPTLAVDPTNHARLAIGYYDYSQGRQCSLALSSDAGKTWSIKVVVGDGGQIPLTGEQAKCVSPKIAYGPAETLYYIYQAPRAPGSNPRQVLIATSHDGGATFGPPCCWTPLRPGSSTSRWPSPSTRSAGVSTPRGATSRIKHGA